MSEAENTTAVDEVETAVDEVETAVDEVETAVEDTNKPGKRGPKTGKRAMEKAAMEELSRRVQGISDFGDLDMKPSAMSTTELAQIFLPPAPPAAPVLVPAPTVNAPKGTVLGLHKTDDSVADLTYGTTRSACFDLRAHLKGNHVVAYSVSNRKYDLPVTITAGVRSLLIPPGTRALIPTGYIFNIPDGYKLELFARSGTALKTGVILGNSVGQIDEDYVNELFVMLANVSGARAEIVAGDRIAQGALVEVVRVPFQYESTAPEQKTDRTGGFNSTGVK